MCIENIARKNWNLRQTCKEKKRERNHYKLHHKTINVGLIQCEYVKVYISKFSTIYSINNIQQSSSVLILVYQIYWPSNKRAPIEYRTVIKCVRTDTSDIESITLYITYSTNFWRRHLNSVIWSALIHIWNALVSCQNLYTFFEALPYTQHVSPFPDKCWISCWFFCSCSAARINWFWILTIRNNWTIQWTSEQTNERTIKSFGLKCRKGYNNLSCLSARIYMRRCTHCIQRQSKRMAKERKSHWI